MKAGTQQVELTSIQGGLIQPGSDRLVIEEPLEIVLAHFQEGRSTRQSLSITMRTPGDDFDLVSGFLFAEGVTKTRSDVITMAHIGKQALQSGSSNVVLVTLSPDVTVDFAGLKRNFAANSACGVCGKASLESLEHAGVAPALGGSFAIDEAGILGLPAAAHKLQGIFAETGGAHSAAFFDASGRITCLREDIGRHNALDKLIGAQLQGAAPHFSELGILVSSRASFELLQKAAVAGSPFFAAVGAPSTLAVELAKEFEITLLGFVRKDRFNIYNRPDRVLLSGTA